MPKVLIVEDNTEIAQLIRMPMEDVGHTTTWESDNSRHLAKS